MTGLLLPKNTRLIHIGPQKTGTTALQRALAQVRDQLPQYDVAFPGSGTRARAAGWAIGLQGSPPQRPPIQRWTNFCDSVNAASASRVIVSDENYARAKPELIPRIVTDLSGEAQPHVVAFARRLDMFLPSQWQERVKNGVLDSFDEWMRRILTADNADDYEWRNVWLGHDPVSLAQRWGAEVGPENFTLVIADPTNRNQIFDVFEQLLGIPTGLLASVDHGDAARASNRSMSWEEAELIRTILRQVQDLGWSRYDRLLAGRAMVRALRETELHAPVPATRPQLPRWALEQLPQLTDRHIEQLQQLPIRIIGEVEHLRVTATPTEAVPAPTTVPHELAAIAARGLIKEYGLSPRQARERHGQSSKGAEGNSGPRRAVEDVGGRELLKAAAARLKHRIGGLRSKRGGKYRD